MCADIDTRNKSLKPTLDCPSHCVTRELKDQNQFEINDEGALKLKTEWKDQADVHDYCASYQCLDPNVQPGWKPVVEACLCPKPDIFQKLYQGIETCCPNANVTQSLKCDGSLKLACQDNSKSINFNRVNITGSKATFKPNFAQNFLTLSKNQVCVGFKPDFIETKLFYCPPVCQEGNPCIKQCCDDQKGKLCKKGDITNDEKKTFQELKQFADDQNFQSYFVYASKTCNDQNEKPKYLNTNKCSERLVLEKKGNEISMKYNYGDTILGQDDYCLILSTQSAQICKEVDPSEDKFKFYPVIQVISCFFLFLTIVIYLYHYKRLVTSSYTVFMLNFATMLFLAFLVLAING